MAVQAAGELLVNQINATTMSVKLWSKCGVIHMDIDIDMSVVVLI